jgi:two-component system, OmpR family, response regulator
MPSESGTLKVVVVEDSAVIRERLIEMLSALSWCQVIGQYEDAGGAIDGIRDHMPHVVLLDIRLRDSSGMQVLKHIEREAPHIKVIVLTNYAEPQYRKMVLAAGALHLLDKSREFERVPELLREIMQAP